MPLFTDFLTDFEKKKTTVLQSRIVERTRNAFISFNSEINFVQFLYKNVQLTNKIVFAFNKKIRSTFVKYAPSPPKKKKSRWRGNSRLSPEAWRSLSNHQSYKCSIVVNFLSQVIFVFLLFLGMLMYANEDETKEK